MTFQQFLKQENITLPPTIEKLCHEGWVRLEMAVDTAHGLDHVISILSQFSKLRRHEKFPRKIRLNILLPAIIWHDSWKAQRNSRWPHILFFDQLWDGHGSYRLFCKATENKKIPAIIREEIGRIIRDHSFLPLERHHSLEYKILHDLDTLEEWHLPRLHHLLQRSGSQVVRFAAWIYLRYILGRQTERNYHFGWSKKEFRKRKISAPGGI